MELMRMSAPIVLASLAGVLSGFIDTVMMGYYSVAGIAAVAIGATIYAVMSQVLAASTTGYTVLSARHFGAGKSVQVGVAFRSALLLSGMIALIFLLVAAVMGKPLVGLFTSSQGVVAPSASYLAIRSVGLPLRAATILMISTFNGSRDTRWALYSTAIMAGLDIVLNIPLIYGFAFIPSLGAVGDALSSTIADLAGMVFVATVFLRSGLRSAVRPFDGPMSRSAFAENLSISLPPMLSAGFDYIATSVFFVFMGYLGTRDLAAGRLVFSTLIFVFSVVASLSIAGRVMISRALGENDERKAKLYDRTNLAFMMTFALVPFLGLTLFARQLLGLMTGFGSVATAGAPSLLLVGLSIPLMVLSRNIAVNLQARKATRQDMWSNLAAIWLVQLPLGYIWIRVAHGGLAGLFVSYFVYWGVRALIGGFLLGRLVGRAQRIGVAAPSDS